MSLPVLSLEVVIFNLEDAFLALQGVSRYIHSIFIREDFVVNEGVNVLNVLQFRYPKKKIVLNLSRKVKIDSFLEKVIKKTTVNSFVLVNHSDSSFFQKLCHFLHLQKKQIIIMGQKIDLPFLKKYQIKHFLYYKSKKDNSGWNASDLEQIKLLKENGFFVSVGAIIDSDIEHFKNVSVDEFLVSEEVCYSFNPIQTCKLIYSKIKEIYPKKAVN